jgi:hypothetical protein
METEAKYYTPTLEEVYVGFELEWRSDVRGEPWNKQVCDVDLISIFYDAYEHSDIEEPFDEQFRVKYLNTEDIESFGFVCILDDIRIQHYRRGNFILKTDYDLGSYINEDFNLYSIVYNPYESQYNDVFSGIIKNKSELKKVLQMIGAM